MNKVNLTNINSMIKAPKYLVSAALVLMTLAGCGSGDFEPDIDAGRVRPKFTATIGSAQSRAYDRSWDRGDKIGISCGSRNNVCHITNQGDGIFTVLTSGEQIYFDDAVELTFTAYYPWNTLDGGVHTVDADTKEQTRQKDFDFLWAKTTGKKEDPAVTFRFSHKMAKVAFTVKPGTGMSFDEVKDARLSLDGFSHAGRFDVTAGTTVITGPGDAGQGQWMFTDAPSSRTDNALTYSLIFFPQTLDAPLQFSAELPGNNILKTTIDFTAANRELDGATAKNEWVAGRQYNLSVTLHKTGCTLDKCEINPWNEVNGDEINVD